MKPDEHEPLEPFEPPPPSLISDRLKRVLDTQEQEAQMEESVSATAPQWPEFDSPRAARLPMLAMLLVGLLAGIAVTLALRAPATAPPSLPAANATIVPSPLVTDPAVALQHLLVAPSRIARPSNLPSVLMEAQTTDPKARAELLARLKNEVEIGRFDPFRKIAPVRPKSPPLPALPPRVAEAPLTPPPVPATPPPRMESIQLRLTVVMTGAPRQLGLVEGVRDGRPFKTRVGVGQQLLDEFTVEELDMNRMRIQSKRQRLTLPLGQMKIFQRAIPAFPVVAAPPLPPVVISRKQSAY